MTYIVRTLCFQPTDHIVWAGIGDNSAPGWTLSYKRVPSLVSLELDYRVYAGPIDSIPKFWTDIKNYRLAKEHWKLSELFHRDLPEEFRSKIKVMRAKCYAIMGINSHVRFYKERHDLYENPLLSPHLTIDGLANIFKKNQVFTDNTALKLAQFKKDELLANLKYITELQAEAELVISHMTSSAQIVEYYNSINNQLGMTNAYNITKMNIL